MACKRKLLTIGDKYAALIDVEKGVTKSVIADRLGVSRSTLSCWIRDAEKIRKAYETGSFSHNTKRMKVGKYPKTEEATSKWLLEARAANINISGTILKIKAEDFAQQLGEDDFKAGNGWLFRFRQRHGIVHRTIRGEGRGVDQAVVDDFRATVPARLLEEFRPEDIFNMDETGLSYLAQSTKTLTFRDDSAIGTKQPKNRLTVVPCANMTGTEKRQLLVIGRYLRPRCFKNAILPCKYDANARAWMTSDVFRDWCLQWDRQLSRRGRRIALLLDNAPGHPALTLDNIKLVYLPPNTTSHTQPLDQGIIANFKSHYRHIFTLNHLCPAMKADKPLDFDVLKALDVCVQAWSRVTPRTIARCFRRAGFMHPDIVGDDDEDEDKLTGSSGRDLFYDGVGDKLNDVKTKKNAEIVL